MPAVAGGQHSGAGAVAPKDAGISILIIERSRHDFRRHHKNIFIVYARKIEENNQKSFKSEKDAIETELKQCKAIYIINKKQKEILDNAKIKINENNVDKLHTKIEHIVKTLNEPIDYLIEDTSILAGFTINKKRQELTVADFLNFFYHLKNKYLTNPQVITVRNNKLELIYIIF